MIREQQAVVQPVRVSPVLRTGDRFIAKSKIYGEILYEFVGFAPFCSDDRSYLIIKNVQTGCYTGFEYRWFKREMPRRIIRILHKKRR